MVSVVDKDPASYLEAQIQVFLRELTSILAVEESGDIGAESVEKIKSLLIDFWDKNSRQASENMNRSG